MRLRPPARLVLVLVGVASLMTPAYATAAREYRVLQLNLCHGGLNTACFRGAATIREALQVITAKRPDVVSLNEICREDVPELAAAMGGGFGTFAPARRPDGTPSRCTNGDEYGNGLIFRSSVAGEVSSAVYAAQDGGPERRVYVCVEYPDLIGCATHLSTKGGVAKAQCAAAIGLLRGRAAAGKQTVLAGDFNLRYASTVGPDVQDCNAPPFYRKGDGSVQHVFAANVGYVRTETTWLKYTDHPALLVVLNRR
ncbi:hypothetical protein GCM10009677_34540 [Sphaerisporangium rubeum]|uniref:Endonuclease/exonuclease/phosphatase domain-containing protein n=1 Tax=Sphaerisporangium rubeum TaxID=321317 RepID=A0A7X0M8T5_9ACTN|nr:endonuclease/exonuclease/phosphatase family protein [Sphaerisporangium rubeum]MBB6474231.1 hypothetical protein [Sphaerisporangium rubeum]